MFRGLVAASGLVCLLSNAYAEPPQGGAPNILPKATSKNTTPETACWDAISGRNGVGIFKNCAMYRNQDGTIVAVRYMMNIDQYKAICELDSKGNILSITSEHKGMKDCR